MKRLNQENKMLNLDAYNLDACINFIMLCDIEMMSFIPTCMINTIKGGKRGN